MPEHKETLVLMGLGSDGVVERQTRIIDFLNSKRPSKAQILVFPVLWQTPEKYYDKRARLGKFIRLHPDIETVYGISAGASLAMCLVPEMDDSTEFHFVSGKLRRPETIDDERNERAPAFYESVVASETAIANTDLANHNLTCHVGFLDGVLRQQDMKIPGVPVHRIPMVNHTATITLAYFTLLRKL